MARRLHELHFTLLEAEKLLSEIAPVVMTIRALKRKLDALGYDILRHQYFGGRGPNGEGSFPLELERLVECVKNLNQRGILLKDLDQGLIDFPHLRSNGEEVYLCWRPSDGELVAWHGLGEGFAGRKPLSEL